MALRIRAGSVAGTGGCAEMCRAALDTIRIPVPYPCDFFIGSHLDLIGIKNKSFLSKNSLLLKESHSQTNPGADIYQTSFRPEGTISDAQERCQKRRRGRIPHWSLFWNQRIIKSRRVSSHIGQKETASVNLFYVFMSINYQAERPSLYIPICCQRYGWHLDQK